MQQDKINGTMYVYLNSDDYLSSNISFSVIHFFICIKKYWNDFSIHITLIYWWTGNRITLKLHHVCRNKIYSKDACSAIFEVWVIIILNTYDHCMLVQKSPYRIGCLDNIRFVDHTFRFDNDKFRYSWCRTYCHHILSRKRSAYVWDRIYSFLMLHMVWFFKITK